MQRHNSNPGSKQQPTKNTVHTKVILKIKGGTLTFQDNHNLKQSTTNKPEGQNIFKVILHTEEKERQ
jgi:hypothetical protein